jgi:hypothetical protein
MSTVISARSRPDRRRAAAVLATIDRRFAVHAVLWTVASVVAFGVVAAIIPNPIFGRQIPVEPFAIGVWLISAPLMGLLGATYTAPGAIADAEPSPLVLAPATAATDRNGRTLATIASAGAFLAIGCPVCNKVALVLLGTSGAMTIFAPLQPVIGAVSLVLLAGTLGWRFRLRTKAWSCRR